jgi:hypothetical protein
MSRKAHYEAISLKKFISWLSSYSMLRYLARIGYILKTKIYNILVGE